MIKNILFGFAYALLFVQTHQYQDLWTAELHDVENVTLEKGKPIQLQTPHTGIQLWNLQGTIYSDTFSKFHNVTELGIRQSSIDRIEPGALCFPSLRKLELDFSDFEAPPLNDRVFENCNIEELILRFKDNTTYKIDNEALLDLTNLKILYLRNYKLGHLQKNFLQLPKNKLSVLVLSQSDIHQIDSDVFEDFEHLEEVSVVRNRALKTIPKDLFNNNSKLKTLNLRSNGLETWDEFEGLANVERLDLSRNKIGHFSNAAKIAKHLPNLKNFDIAFNPASCYQKEAFANELKQKLKNVIVRYLLYPSDTCYYDD